MNTKRILITGGAGFIGSHLCDAFLSAGHEVICVDNFISGSRANIAHLLNNPHFELIEHDVTLPLTINYQLSAVLHFATPASPNPRSPVSYMSHPVATMMVTSIGTKHMLDLARTNGCQIILASTSEVYGDPLVHPQTEDYRGNVSCTGVRACYDEGKRFMEALSMVYHREYGVKTKIIRIFNTYGPRMRLDDGRFTINLIDSYLNNTPFRLHGEMTKITRSFCYIDDLIEGITQVYASDAMVGNVVNLGNPKELTLYAALEIFEKIIDKKLDTIQTQVQIDDPKKRKPDISKAKRLLNWEPKIDFAEGIKRTLDYYSHKS
ncbi:MAG: SDR family oxidoreductase [Candidatus Microgenomates bacterium]